jgi:hypothetical protein
VLCAIDAVHLRVCSDHGSSSTREPTSVCCSATFRSGTAEFKKKNFILEDSSTHR